MTGIKIKLKDKFGTQAIWTLNDETMTQVGIIETMHGGTAFSPLNANEFLSSEKSVITNVSIDIKHKLDIKSDSEIYDDVQLCYIEFNLVSKLFMDLCEYRNDLGTASENITIAPNGTIFFKPECCGKKIIIPSRSKMNKIFPDNGYISLIWSDNKTQAVIINYRIVMMLKSKKFEIPFYFKIDPLAKLSNTE